MIAINSGDMNEINQQVQMYMEEFTDGSYRCTVCGKKTKENSKRYDMVKHVETHIEGLSYTCPICLKTFKSRNSLSKHKSVNHNK